MIKRIFTIAFLYLKTTYSSKTTLISAIAMPLLFTFVLGSALNNNGPGEGQIQIGLAVVDQDQTALSEILIDRLEADPAVKVQFMDESTARAELEDVMSAALIIPAGFGDALEAGETADLNVLQNSNEFSQAQLLTEAVQAAAAEIAGSFAAADIATHVAREVGLFDHTDIREEAYRSDAFAEAESSWKSGAPVAVAFDTVSRIETDNAPNGASQSSPGMMVMFALSFTFTGGAILLVERDQGTLRRLLVMPMGKGTLMTGKLVGIYLGSLFQMTIMVLVGQFAFGVEWGRDPIALAVMLLAYALTGTALGLMLAALVKTTAQVSAAGTIAMMSLASLGGAWWPIEIVPSWMQSLALALPTGWAMRGFHDIITRGLGLSAILLEASVLVAFAAAFLVIGIWRFKYE